ncbi:Protein of unknown function (DUF998) [Micromonospora viridifaciens]|uniref:DUF998 domain-containing protein n=1 Tax=Micromonospora viridifaciens TaxID=1881 RepID=A0A1C4XRV7_MICVI|nr:DUF998 domain-containing protein [Micromonospora viridifaciens]SCF11215.1 Protein of unknown function (DUF998) [Micromonospora viridifaciens]
MPATDPPTRTAPAPRRTASIQPATAPDSPRAGRRRTPVDMVLVGLALPLVGFAVADLVNPDWSPVETMVSHYVHAPRGGWLIPAGLLIMAAASAALIRPAVAHTRGGRGGLTLLGVWAAALLLGGVFPANPAGQWDQPPTLAGTLHGVAALIAFTILPAAAVILTRVWRRDPRWRPVAGALAVVAAMSVAAFALFTVTFFDVLDGPDLAVGPWSAVVGLTERVMVWADVAWLAVAAAGLRRIAWDG